ncbi:hypothetical protein ACLOJK_029680, partial [Asimina triloba]
ETHVAGIKMSLEERPWVAVIDVEEEVFSLEVVAPERVVQLKSGAMPSVPEPP